jgi:DNA-binding transcriptional MocR family regulator
MAELPDIQMDLRPGFVEFGWGHPDLALLPLAGLQAAAAAALSAGNWQALAYGAAQGPGRLIALLCARLADIDGRAMQPDQLLITAGVSQALDLVCDLCTQPGDVALVESPVYHFGLRILRDHGLRLLPVATDEDGLRLDALEDALAQLHRTNRRPALLYTVPTFNNPTGRNLAAARREPLMQLAAAHDLLVLEDDVYRELWFETPPPSSLTHYGPSANIVRLGSFSKILAPGLRLGWIQADPALVRKAANSGLLTSGGGINHLTAHMVAEYLRMGLLDEHVAQLRAVYRTRRDALVAALAHYLPPECRFEPPGGGFFIWLQLPEGMDSVALLARAEAARVGYVPGAHFHIDGGGHRQLRLAFSLLSPAEMEEGARRLAQILQ